MLKIRFWTNLIYFIRFPSLNCSILFSHLFPVLDRLSYFHHSFLHFSCLPLPEHLYHLFCLLASASLCLSAFSAILVVLSLLKIFFKISDPPINSYRANEDNELDHAFQYKVDMIFLHANLRAIFCMIHLFHLH